MSVAEIFQTMTYGPAPEAPDTAYAWLDAHERKFGLFVNNKWVEPKTGKYLPSANPATSEPLAQFADAGKADVDAAVAAAREAFASWGKLPGHARARHLYAIALPATSRSTTACWQCWSRSTTASRSANRVTSTSR
jgi:aldehyde dehydrogenase (NAD+)